MTLSINKFKLVISPGRCGTKFIVNALNNYFVSDLLECRHERKPLSQAGFIYSKLIRIKQQKFTQFILSLRKSNTNKEIVFFDPILISTYISQQPKIIEHTNNTEFCLCLFLTRDFINWLISFKNRIYNSPYRKLVFQFPKLGFSGTNKHIKDIKETIKKISDIDATLASYYIEIHKSYSIYSDTIPNVNYQTLFNTENKYKRIKEWSTLINSIGICNYELDKFDNYISNLKPINSSYSSNEGLFDEQNSMNIYLELKDYVENAINK